MPGNTASLTFKLFGIDVNASRTISGVGVAAAGTAKDLEVLSVGTLKFVAAAGAAGVASVGLAGTLGVGLGAAFAGVGVAAALMNKDVRKHFKDLGQGIKNQLAATAKPVQDAMLQLVKYTREAFKTMGPLLHSFFQAVAPLVTIFGQGLVQAIANVVGEFTPLIRVVTPIVKELFAQLPDLIGNIAFTLKEILAPLSGNTRAFGQLLQTIGSLLPIVGSIIGSLVRLGQQIMPTFQKAILAVGTALDGALGQVLPLVGQAIEKMLPPIVKLAGALLPALGAILRALLPILSSVVAAFADALAKALPALVPGFVALIQVIGQLLKGIEPLLPSLTYLALWISKVANNLLSAIIPAATAILGALLPALKTLLPIIIQVVNQVGTALAEAFKQAIPSLILLARAAGQILVAVTPLIPVVLAAALAFTPLIPAAAKIAAVLAQGLVPIVLTLTPLLVFLAPTLVKLAVAAKLYAVAQGILNVVLAANPIGLVIIALTALAAGLVYAWKHSETFRNIVTGSFNKVKEIISNVWQWVKDHWPLLLAVLTGPIGAAAIFIIRNWDKIKQGASDAFTTIVNWFKSLPGRITGAIGHLGSLLFQQGKNLLGGLWDGIKQKWNDVVGWFKGLPSKILSALGIHSPPDWAVDAGGHIMGGILKGLAHGAADVAGFFRGLASDVTGPLAGVWASLFRGPTIGGKSYGSNRELVRALAERLYGWVGEQWIALANLLSGESGFNNLAQNPTSSAFGLFQFLDSTWQSVGVPKTSDPYAQTIAGLRYIAGRYGSPAAAYGAWLGRTPHWYASGLLPTVFTRPTLIGVGESGAETVSVTRGRAQGGVGNTYHFHFHGTVGSKTEIIAWVRQGMREARRAEGRDASTV